MAHSFDAKSQITLTTSDPASGSHTCGSGATVLVLTIVYEYGTRTGTPTFDSSPPMNFELVAGPISAVTSPETCVEMWYLLDPPTGSAYNVSIPNPNNLNLEACASSYAATSGKKSALSVFNWYRADAKWNNPGWDQAYMTPSQVGGVIVGVVGTGLDSWNPTGRLGTQLYDTDNGSWGAGHQYYVTTNNALRMVYWLNSGTDDDAIIIAEFVDVDEGINVPKAGVFPVLAAPEGISVPKAAVFPVLAAPEGISVVKAAVFSIIRTPNIPVSMGDVAQPVEDAITTEIQKSITLNLGDVAAVPVDSFVNLLKVVHISGTVSDQAMVPQDQLQGGANYDFNRTISDVAAVPYDGAVDPREAVGGRIDYGVVDLVKTTRWVAPLTITPKTDVIEPLFLAAHPVRHPRWYFAPRVKSYATFTRAIGAPASFVRTGDARVEILDPDNQIRRGIWAKTIRKATAELRLGPEGASFTGFLRPYKREVGFVDQPSDGVLSLNLRDYVYDPIEEEVPADLDKERFPNLPDPAPTDFSPIIIGEVESEGGALTLKLVDTVAFGYLVARHHCEEVTVFRKTADDEDFVEVTSGYTLSNPDDGPCVVEFSSDQEGAEIRANVTGLTEFTNFADFIREIFLTIIPDAADRINFQSFDTVRDLVEDIPAAGAVVQKITFGEVLSQIQRSSNIDIFSDKNDRITIRYTADDEEPVVHLDDTMRLFGGSVSQSLAEPTKNQIPYRYAPKYSSGEWIEDVWNNEVDQEAMGGEITKEETLNLYWIRDADAAAIVLDHRGQWLDLDSFRFNGTIPLIPVLESLELADLVSVQHFGGLAAAGYAAEQFKILELAMDVDRLRYSFKGIRRKLPAPPLVEAVLNGQASNNSRVGPFYTERLGQLFAVFLDPTDRRILRVWSTEDYGANWVEADAANHPVLAEDIGSHDAYQSGDELHVATQTYPSQRVAYHVFNTLTGLWTTVDEEVVSGVSNGNFSAVSIETRNATNEPVIFFQGERELKSGVFYKRGYYSIKIAESWATPVLVTPDPYSYPTDRYGPNDADCTIERVVAGRENRLHFFWGLPRSVIWIRWTPDHYGRTLQGDLTFGDLETHLITGISYPPSMNLGDGGWNSDRTRYYTVRKTFWGYGYVERYTEGETWALDYMEEWGWMYNSWVTNNPAGFARVFGNEEDGEDIYVGMNNWFYRTMLHRRLRGESEFTLLPAGPQYLYPNWLYTLNGTIVPVRNLKYMAYFSDPGYPSYRWIRIADLPWED